MTKIIANTCGYDAAKSIARDILNMQEKAGMLPPEITPAPQHIIDSGQSANYWEEE